MGQAAEALGLSASTGAFAAGVLLAGNRYRAQIQADIKPFEGILLGVFFMTAGASLDPSVVVREWPTLLTGIAAFIVTKAAVLFAAGPALGLTRGESAKVALTLSGGGEFSFVVFQLASSLGVLPEALAKLLTAAVILSMSLTPLLGEVAERVAAALDALDAAAEDGGATMRLAYTLTATRGDLEAAGAALFAKIDADGSDSISLDELREALLEQGLPYVSIAVLFAALDADGDGSVDSEEWRAGIAAGLLDDALEAAATLTAADASGALPVARDAIVVCAYGETGRAVYRAVCEARSSSDAHTRARIHTHAHTHNTHAHTHARTHKHAHVPVRTGPGCRNRMPQCCTRCVGSVPCAPSQRGRLVEG